jgi:hypothetical protein
MRIASVVIAGAMALAITLPTSGAFAGGSKVFVEQYGPKTSSAVTNLVGPIA